MTYGIPASESCLLTDIFDTLHETSKKVNTVERLSLHLKNGISPIAKLSYRSLIRKWIPENPVIHIDDSDIIKPDGYKFESLGTVRDGSKSSSSKSIYQKGYLVTEACVLTNSSHPVSFCSHIHSSKEKTLNPQIRLLLKRWKSVQLFLKTPLL